MNPFLLAYSNSYLDGEKLYKDIPEYGSDSPSGGLISSAGSTAEKSYMPPKVDSGSSASDIAYMYRQYADQNGGDTEANRNAAIDYLRQNGVSDDTIGSAYGSYQAKGGYQAPNDQTAYMTPGGMGGSMADSRTKSTGSPGGGMDGFVIGGVNTRKSSVYPSSPSITPTATQYGTGGVATAEGRISGLLGIDQSGNYSNQVVRQAADRALQAFAGRGLLNSSMAQQAAQEAAISKATEIATTDAGFINTDLQKDKDRQFQNDQERIAFDRQLQQLAIQQGYDIDKLREQYGLETTKTDKNTNQTNEWSLQSSYRTQRQQADLNYNSTINNINVSQMTPEQKQAAVAAATETRDAELATLNEVYARAPNWKNEWSTVAVLTSEAGVKSITSVSRLTSIINDPAQPESMRAAARARVAELQTSSPAAPAAPSGLIPTANNVNDRIGD